MKVQVQLINERGRPLATRARANTQKYQGQLRINEERSQELGRAVVTAQLLSGNDGTLSPVLPTLYDVAMLYVRDDQIRVRGFEMVEGVQFGQTWDIKVL